MTASRPRKEPKMSTRISVWIIITLVGADVLLTWLAYWSGLDEFWTVFILNQVWFTIAITNYQALYLVPYVYRKNEGYYETTKKTAHIIGISFKELERRGYSDEEISERVVQGFRFMDENREELQFFYDVVIKPVRDRIVGMSEEDRRVMIHKIGVGTDYYLDKLESLSDLTDDEVRALLKLQQRRKLKERNKNEEHKDVL